MKVISLFLAVAALGSAAAQGFTWDGTVAGPCSLSANFPAGNANCPDPASQRAICQGRFTVQPDGAPVAGAGTLSNPTLVPVKLTYENNPQCTTTMQQHNVSVFSSSQAGTKLSLLSVVQSSGESDTVGRPLTPLRKSHPQNRQTSTRFCGHNSFL